MYAAIHCDRSEINTYKRRLLGILIGIIIRQCEHCRITHLTEDASTDIFKS